MFRDEGVGYQKGKQVKSQERFQQVQLRNWVRTKVIKISFSESVEVGLKSQQKEMINKRIVAQKVALKMSLEDLQA